MFEEPRPSFKRPPVVEVALSVQFNELPEFQVAHYGRFWAEIADRLPRTGTRPPLDNAIEYSELKPREAPSFQLLGGYPGARTWFFNNDETALVQLQSDRFVYNWRQLRTGMAYPRYEVVRQQFGEYFDRLKAFVAREQLGEIVPVQCEVTYINHIEIGGPIERLTDLPKLLRFWSEPTYPLLKSPEQNVVRLAFRIEHEGSFWGRLHFAVEPRIRLSDQKDLLQVSLTARGHPKTPDLDGVVAFFDLGREHIVRGFAALTTPEMHKHWERDDA